MCRWLAYSGDPIRLESLLSRPENSLIHQSRESEMGATVLNADGFGVGWYGEDDPVPGLYRSTHPAWADANLTELGRLVRSRLFVAHVRATTGTAVQQTNCHPFRHGRWLWAHNGAVRDYASVRRDLVLAVEPSLFPSMAGSTDSEVMFHLALTFGLADDPVGAVQRMAGFVEDVGRAHGVEHPLQMTVLATDGGDLYAFRYSSEGRSRTLFHSAEVAGLRERHPEVAELAGLSDETRAIVSEPLGRLPGAWVEFPESSYGVVRPGRDAVESFHPEHP
jgi:predicted glutamine amidotransferase